MSRTLLRLARSRAAALFTACVGLFLTTATVASAETLMMPNRPTLTTVNTVVWGVTTQANGTGPCSIDFGDGSGIQNCVGGVVGERSFIAFDHTYALAGTYTATLTVGVESATAQIQAFNPAAPSLTPEALRGVNINRAIEDGLRYLWVNQTNRIAGFPTSATTTWTGIAGYDGPAAGLVTLAFENHGYKVPTDNSAPTGLYEKYIVRRGLNQILNVMEQVNLTQQTAGNPCVGLGAGPDPDGGGPALCVGLAINQDSNAFGAGQFNHSSYETPFAMSALGASGAPNRMVAEIPGTGSGGFVVGKTYAEVLQRLTNAVAWGQQETGTGRGGWYYALNYGSASDGSTVGWVMLGLLDAEAGGATLPAFVRTEWTPNALVNAINSDGSFDYQSNSNAASPNSVNVAKAGVGLQGMFFGGVNIADAKVQNALTYIGNRWNEQNPVSLGTTQTFICQGGRYNKGCGYAMFNVFKGFKLYGISTLAGVTRPAGPGAIPAADWYADYVDWLLAFQTAPTTQAGGNWQEPNPNNLGFSSQTTNESAEAALAELILSPVVLIQPDPETFSQVGLKQGNPLSVNPMSNPVGTQHTVVAKAESSGQGIPGVTISFQVTGRNATTGSGQTGNDGTVSFSYTDTGNVNVNGDDNIQAFIGQVGSNISSNVLIKHWVIAGAARCDANADGVVTQADLVIINGAMGQPAAGPTDARDGNGDGAINIADVRYCQRRLTPL